MKQSVLPPQLDLQIVIVSGEEWSKCRPALEAVLPDLRPGQFLTVLYGEAEAQPPPQLPHTEFLLFAGESVFEMRSRLPEIIRDAKWVALLEDHVVPLPGWIAGVSAAIASPPAELESFSASAVNETSTARWDWPNFLFNFAFHWNPGAGTDQPMTVATAIFRRDLLGATRLPLHEFELKVLGRPGPILNDVAVNHIQRVGFLDASMHVFDNGLVSGDAMRVLDPNARKNTIAAVLKVQGERQRQIKAFLKAHPRWPALPRGTLLRLRWIALCHSLGVLVGATFGSGDAHRRLE
jgi:hypothetical protein